MHHIVLTSVKAEQRLDDEMEGCVSDIRMTGSLPLFWVLGSYSIQNHSVIFRTSGPKGTVVSEFLLPITHCSQSRDYSIGNEESHVNSNGIWHVRILPLLLSRDCLPCTMHNWEFIEKPRIHYTPSIEYSLYDCDKVHVLQALLTL